MLVGLIIGHTGRPPFRDHGTSTPDGQPETLLSFRYALSAMEKLKLLGHQALILSDGSYRERWDRLNALSIGCAIQCHVNGGRAEYGLVIHDHRSANRNGPALAGAIATALDTVRYYYTGRETIVRAGRPDNDGMPRDEDWTEAYNTIAGLNAPAVCFEPFFSHGPCWKEDVSKLDDIGQALARGIDAWAKHRGN